MESDSVLALVQEETYFFLKKSRKESKSSTFTTFSFFSGVNGESSSADLDDDDGRLVLAFCDGWIAGAECDGSSSREVPVTIPVSMQQIFVLLKIVSSFFYRRGF